METNSVSSKLAGSSSLKSSAIKGHKYLAEPSRITHYTTIDGLIGIVEKVCIWASNVSYLNDRQELLHGLRGTTEAIELFMSETAYRKWAAILRSVVKEIENGRMANTYAACFCASSDVLSQWRGYSGSEQGISVTFDRVKLESMLSTQKAKLFPIVYGTLSTKQQITDALMSNFEELNIWEYATGQMSAAERRDRVYKVVSRLLPQFKHAGFRDEREWRFIVQQETVRDQVCFRSAGNVIVPYLKLGPGPRMSPLGPGSAGQLPIDSVRVGPGRDMDLTKRSVELYLATKGYQNVKVLVSQVPFRV